MQAVKLKNKHQGVDYINAECIYFKKHLLYGMSSQKLHMSHHYDGSPVNLGRSFEAHLLMPDSKQAEMVKNHLNEKLNIWEF